MGTRGLFAIKYKGHYYIKYNHSDSYPDGLGRDLVSAIPTTVPEFKQWLEDMEKLCEGLASSGDGNTASEDGYKKSIFPPENDLIIEWTYTYDLDSLNFVVDSKAHFDLLTIALAPPDAWMEFIASDARGDRCLSLETPSWLVGPFVSSSPPFLGGDAVPSEDQFVATSTISPSTWSNPLTPHYRRLMFAYVNLSIAETYSTLSTFHRYTLASVDHQDIALSFLEAIIPNNQAIVVNRRSPILTTCEPDDPTTPSSRGPWFWYRGCLILLAKYLDIDERFQRCVQAVAARVKAKNLDRCTALLWSIHHVAVIEINGGSVSCSGPIPLLAAYGSNEEGFISALHLLWHYLPYPRWRMVDERATHSSDFGIFPTEVIMKIMAFTDQLHYPKYQFLSRRFFSLWWKHLRLASYTILPDAEETEDASRCLHAYSDDNVRVKLQLQYLWGKKTGAIWRSDATDRDEGPISCALRLYIRQQRGGRSAEEAEDFSREYTKLSYRFQRFYSYWPEELAAIKGEEYSLPRVADQFSSQSNILLCKVEPM